MNTRTIERLDAAVSGKPVLCISDGFSHTSPELRGAVEQAQRVLARFDYHDLAVDGLFGRATESAVENFQTHHGLLDDGIIGPVTWAALLSDATAEELAEWFPFSGGRRRRGLRGHVPRYQQYASYVRSSAERHGIPLAVGFAIGSRESGWGLYLEPQDDPAGVGDNGHDRGLLQIDDRYHKEFVESGDWQHPAKNIEYGLALLRDYTDKLKGVGLIGRVALRAGIAAYNCGTRRVQQAVRAGRPIDFYTTGRDYSADVLDRAGYFQRNVQ